MMLKMMAYGLMVAHLQQKPAFAVTLRKFLKQRWFI